MKSSAWIFDLFRQTHFMVCEEREIYIPYPDGETTRVYVNCDDKGSKFVVFLAGEEGNLILYSETDASGNETWYEGDNIASSRATEIGKLLEIN